MCISAWPANCISCREHTPPVVQGRTGARASAATEVRQGHRARLRLPEGGQGFYNNCIKRGILVELAECQRAVKVYRAENPNTVQFWYDTERCAIQAVKQARTKQNPIVLRHVKFYLEQAINTTHGCALNYPAAGRCATRNRRSTRSNGLAECATSCRSDGAARRHADSRAPRTVASWSRHYAGRGPRRECSRRGSVPTPLGSRSWVRYTTSLLLKTIRSSVGTRT